ncbi:MAG: sigma-54-dependent Fis family transcriptional regulator, partial [Planctomycetaceae bacterium]|nr:sigma-54-dependent Fis family transcriptional regulator [Planctomycetaceae bacterium]
KGTIETAVQAMKLGAFDYLQKPFPLQDLETVIRGQSAFALRCRPRR